MEANEPKKEQNTEEMDVMKQFMELLGQQGMKEQSQDFMEVLQYIAGMQLQLSAMVDELQGVRKQLERMQESQPKAAESQLLDKVSYLQEKVSSLAERLSSFGERHGLCGPVGWRRGRHRGRSRLCHRHGGL